MRITILIIVSTFLTLQAFCQVNLNEIASTLGVSPAILEDCCDSPNVNKYGLGSACPGSTPDQKLANLQADHILGYFMGYDHFHIQGDPAYIGVLSWGDVRMITTEGVVYSRNNDPTVNEGDSYNRYKSDWDSNRRLIFFPDYDWISGEHRKPKLVIQDCNVERFFSHETWYKYIETNDYQSGDAKTTFCKILNGRLFVGIKLFTMIDYKVLSNYDDYTNFSFTQISGMPTHDRYKGLTYYNGQYWGVTMAGEVGYGSTFSNSWIELFDTSLKYIDIVNNGSYMFALGIEDEVKYAPLGNLTGSWTTMRISGSRSDEWVKGIEYDNAAYILSNTGKLYKLVGLTKTNITPSGYTVHGIVNTNGGIVASMYGASSGNTIIRKYNGLSWNTLKICNGRYAFYGIYEY